MKKDILGSRTYYKPFAYPWAYEMWLQSEQSHWIHTLEVPMHEDVKDWKLKLNDKERDFITNILRFFTQGDIDVSEGYVDRYLPKFKHPELRMMLLSFGAREAVHIAAYSHLIESLNMPDKIYKAFLDYAAMRDKHEFVGQKYEDLSEEKQLALDIAIFSALTEGVQLFSSFIMLLNFVRHGKMKAMGQLISWSLADEAVIEGTEVLTESGWIPIEELTLSDRVLEYDMETKNVSYQYPSKIQHVMRDKSYVFKTAEGLEVQHVSPNHRMITIDEEGNVGEVKAKDAADIITIPTSGLKVKGDNLFTEEVKTFDTVEENTTLKLFKEALTHDIKNFYCLAVPGKAFFVRSKDGVVSVTGNTLHVEGMTKIFRSYIKENIHLWDDDLKQRIYAAAEKMIELEDAFIDLCYDQGATENLEKEDVKLYIRHIADRRLIGLGLKGIFKQKKNPLEWVEEYLNAPTHTNFFENRSTDYAKGTVQGSWSDVWAKE